LRAPTPCAAGIAQRAAFIAATFDRLPGVLVGGASLKVRHIYVDGDTTIAELRSSSRTNEGATFASNYCWVCDGLDELAHPQTTGVAGRQDVVDADDLVAERHGGTAITPGAHPSSPRTGPAW